MNCKLEEAKLNLPDFYNKTNYNIYFQKKIVLEL